MNKKISIGLIGLIGALVTIAGCSGSRAFTTAARPGETIGLAAGWKQQLTRNDLTVVITPASGAAITYAPGDVRVRTIFQGYPDPVSKVVVADRSGVTYPNSGLPNGTPGGYNELPPYFGGTYVRPQTGNENDWSDTFVVLDLPTAIAPGQASIALKAGGVDIMTPALVEVLPLPAANSNTFEMSNFSGTGGMIRSVERASHFVVRFNGPAGVIPHSIQAEFTRTLAATGTAWVTHGRGDITSVMWSDTGSLIKVMLTPVKGISTDNLSDFKFYVTGAVTGLGLNSVKAYDIAGNLLSGFTANIQYVAN